MWTSGLGLVELSAQPTGSPTKDTPSEAALTPPTSTVAVFGFRVLGGGDKLAGQDAFSATLGGAFRYEARHRRSLFAPWVEAGFSATFPTKTTTLKIYDITARGGVDFHPARISYVAFGPFIGYRQIHLRSGDNDAVPDSERSVMLQGVDIGGQIHFRTEDVRGEGPVLPPMFDATIYGFMQGAGLADASNRAFVGVLASAGSAMRGFASVEGCASEAATCFPHQLRLTGGFGGMW